MTLLDRLELRALTPARLWAELGPDARDLAARAVYRTDADDSSGRAEADAAIAAALRFRPQAVRKLSLDKRAAYLQRIVRNDDSLASTLLLALHLGTRRTMLCAFLDRLGVAHDDGVIRAEGFDAPAPDRLEGAVGELYASFPREDVDVYMATLLAMEPETWEGLPEVLERRARPA